MQTLIKVTDLQSAILNGLQGKLVYLNTADAAKVAKRRAKNKLAKASRKANR